MSNMLNSSKTGQPNSDKNLQVQLENGRLVLVNENRYLYAKTCKHFTLKNLSLCPNQPIFNYLIQILITVKQIFSRISSLHTLYYLTILPTFYPFNLQYLTIFNINWFFFGIYLNIICYNISIFIFWLLSRYLELMAASR